MENVEYVEAGTDQGKKFVWSIEASPAPEHEEDSWEVESCACPQLSGGCGGYG